MIEKTWVISQNELTLNLMGIFFHRKNIPFFIIFVFFNTFTSLLTAIVLSLGYFFLMSSLFPPKIMEKDKMIHIDIILFVDRLLSKVSKRVSRAYYWFLNVF